MSNSNAESVFTCVTCNVAFNNSELQRDHYKSDWHRYNLKRKIAEMTPVSYKDFQDRLQLQKLQNENATSRTDNEIFCKLCCKHFNNTNSYQNHLNSKKHKDLEAASKFKEDKDKPESTEKPENESYAVKSDRNAKRAEQLQKKEQEMAEEVAEEGDSIDDKDWEDVDEDDMNSFDESKGIDLNTCLFCPHKSDSMESKCEHMAKEHSFFIPDMDYVSDLEGLLKFLGAKVGAYNVCLWCSGKFYRDLQSVQKHMCDKGHQKMKFEGETLLEYTDFYTYEGDATIDDEYDIADDLDIKTISRISSNMYSEMDEDSGEDMYELVLPSGTKIGHRSLFKYYKQSFGHRNLELKKKSSLTIRDKYKAIASNQAYTVSEIQRQRKDMAYLQRWKSKMHTKLGWNANKLQKHYKRQDITF